MKEGLYTKKLKADRIICSLCQHQCLISPGSKGRCDVRENNSGKLHVLNYEKITNEVVEPISGVPLLHFLPGEEAYLVSTLGTNFTAPASEEKPKKATPDQLAKRTAKEDCAAIAFMDDEPTIAMEMLVEAAKKARSLKKRVLIRTNGYFGQRALNEMIKQVHGAHIMLDSVDKDVFFSMTGAKVFPVMMNIRSLHESKVWVEVGTYFKTDINDKLGHILGIIRFIKDIDPHMPWHVDADDEERIPEIIKMAKEEGLKNVYGPFDDITCHACNKVLLDEEELHIEKGTCTYCQADIVGVF